MRARRTKAATRFLALALFGVVAGFGAGVRAVGAEVARSYARRAAKRSAAR
jgi:hypothetical protein